MLHQSNSDFSGAREPARGLYCRGGRGRCGTLAEALERLDAAAKEVRAVGGEGLAAADVAAPRRRYAASPTASDRSSFMMRQPCTSPWCTCLRSIRRNSTGRATSCRNVRRRCRRSSSRRSPPAPSSSPHRRGAARSMSAVPPSRRSLPTWLRRVCSTVFWPGRATQVSSRRNSRRRAVPTISLSRLATVTPRMGASIGARRTAASNCGSPSIVARLARRWPY